MTRLDDGESLLLWRLGEVVGAVAVLARLGEIAGGNNDRTAHRQKVLLANSWQPQFWHVRMSWSPLELIRDNGSELLFGDIKQGSLYYRYKAIRKAAGLAIDRKSAFHRIRRSVASHLHAAGHNATDALGHQSADVTRKHYLDPALTRTIRPADVLFRPGKQSDGAAVVVIDVSPLEAQKLPRGTMLKGVQHEAQNPAQSRGQCEDDQDNISR